MEVGIIGFERTGKTTLFNALTGQQAETGGYSGRAEPNIAVVEVPEERLDKLAALFGSKKHVRAKIKYIDVAGIAQDEGGGSGLSDALLRAVTNCDALMAVIRAFESAGPSNPNAEVANIQTELILSDMVRVETRLERIEKSIGKQTGDARKNLEREKAVLEKCKAALEAETPIRALAMDADEQKILRTYQFMTVKPLILIVNLDESEIGNAAAWEERVRAKGLPPGTGVAACCASSEMEISQIENPDERREFLESYGIAEPAAARVIRASYETLGLISFFTVGPQEAHAWELHKGDTALQAAGAIHSDLERGFIRAEVIGWDELLRAGSIANAKKEGVYRVEGRTYVMRDGDMIEIRFSV